MKKLFLLIQIIILTNTIMFSQTEWQYLGLAGAEIGDIEIDDNENIYVAVFEGTVYKSSDNGVSWELKNNGLPSAIGSKLAKYNSKLYLATNVGLYKSTDGADSWFRIAQSIPFTDFSEVQVTNNGYIFTSLFNMGTGGVFRSTDEGITWEATSFTGFGALDFGINRNGVVFFCDATLSYHGIYRSFDLGMTWELLYPQMGVDALVYLNDGSVLAGSQGNVWGTIPAGIYKTTNNGDTWSNTNTFGDMSMFTDFVLDSNDDIYVSGGGGGLQVGVHITTDSGISWEYKGLSNVDVSCLAIDSSGYVYAGTASDGIFRMPGRTTPVELVSLTVVVNERDVELSWITATELNNSGFEIQRLQDSNIERLKDWEAIGFVQGFGTTTETKYYSFIDKDVTTGTYKYRLKQIDFDGSYNYYNLNETVEIINQISFLLGQNYPNPFNPTTNISYTIPEDGVVTLKIYDLLGNEMTTLINEDKSAGEYEIEFDARGLSSGTYLYKLNVKGVSGEIFNSTMKMMVIK